METFITWFIARMGDIVGFLSGLEFTVFGFSVNWFYLMLGGIALSAIIGIFVKLAKG